MAQPRSPAAVAGWLAGGGEMGALIRARDWSATPLGPIEVWPQSLRVAVGMMLPSRAQIILFWGADFVVLYNDAYRPVFGGKHPSALGLAGREAWSEIWEAQLGPLLQGVRDTGEAYGNSDLLFNIQRHGYVEETYFDISYDPVRGEDGQVAGIYCIVTETTGRVVGQRRLRSLGLLGRIGMHAGTVLEVFERAAEAIREMPEDVPFALLYEWDAKHGEAHLRASANIERSHPAARAAWLFESLPDEGVVLGQDELPEVGRLPGGRWPEACTRVFVLPIAGPTRATEGFIVAGASPRLAIDEAYRDFLRLVAAGIGGALANAAALEGERRRVEALAALDRAKTAFFSNVSHEFRTPLTLLLGPLNEAITGGGIPDGAREHLEVAYRNGQRLMKLVNMLLDFSRIEAGRMRARFEATDVGVLTSQIASSFESACATAGLRLRIHCEPLPAPVFVDRDMWEKIVLNLVSNAFKFTFEGGIEVRVHAVDERAVLEVRDSGVGIPGEDMPRLFERFHRVEGSRSRTYEGSGIGLALVQELVRMHGGEVRAESQPGQGSVFEVSIPLGQDHLPADMVAAAPTEVRAPVQASVFLHEALGWLRAPPMSGGLPEVAPEGAGRERILVADDNADMREYVERLLGEAWQVSTVADGEAALQALHTARFDLVLTDVMMPRLDGFGLLRAIRSDESLRNLPVVMLSARAGEEARIEGREAGADDYLTKPFSARELVAQVRAQLAVAATRRAAAREREMLLASERAARMDAQRQWEDLVRLFQQAPNPMVILRGRDYVVELANPAACRVWGRTLEQVLHKPLFDALPEARGQGLEPLLAGVLDTGQPCRGRRLVVSLDRGSGPEPVYFDFLYSPLRATSGRVEGVAVTAFDVTGAVQPREELAGSS